MFMCKVVLASSLGHLHTHMGSPDVPDKVRDIDFVDCSVHVYCLMPGFQASDEACLEPTSS